MGFVVSRQVRRRALVGLVGLSALFLAACQPGWVDPVAGTGQAGSSGDGGAAVDATFQQPGSIVYQRSTGAYYVVDDAACVIRKVASDGTISTVAGTGTCGYSGDDGPATEAQIDPVIAGSETVTGGLAQDASGDLYLADSGNGRIRKITPTGVITTAASGFATTTGIGDVVAGDVAVTTNGTLYASALTGGVVRVSPSGSWEQIGTGGNIDAIAADSAGGLFITCSAFGCPNAGVALQHLEEGSSHPVDVAAFSSTPLTESTPIATSLAVDAGGNVYAGLTTSGDHGPNTIVRVDPDGTLTKIAGNGSPDPGTAAQKGDAHSLALTPMGLAATKNNGLLVSSGHVVYRLDHPASTQERCPALGYVPGVDLSGKSLNGANFVGCDLTGANLSSASLQGADFTGADLTDAILTNANLSNARLTDAGLSGTNLSGTTVSGLRSGGVTGTPTALPSGWMLKSGWLIGPGADLSGADMDGVDLTNVSLASTNLDGADLSGASMAGVRSGSITGTPASLPEGWSFRSGWLIGPGADLSGASTGSADFSNLDFTGVNISGLMVLGSDLSGAGLSGAIVTTPPTYLIGNLSGANLSGLNLSTTSFSFFQGATLTNANLDGTNLSNATLTGVVSGGITGVPSALPTDWALKSGWLVGPGAGLANADLSGFDLSGMNLSSANFQYADLSGADLSGATLTSANLQGADLSGADLTGAHLSSANLQGADLSNATLTDADLSNATLTGATVSGADFTGATLTGVKSGSVTGEPAALPDGWVLRSGWFISKGMDLSNAGLSGADLSGLDLSSVNFTGANLSNVDLSGANLTGAIFTSAYLDGTDFTGATMNGVRSGSVTGTPVGLPTDWSVHAGWLIGPGADMSGASIGSGDFSGVNFAGVNLSGAFFVGVDLSGADLSDAIQTSSLAALAGNLTNADLSGLDLSTAIFWGAVMNGTIIEGTDMSSASFNGLGTVTSSGLVGTPAALPPGWTLVDGTLVPPPAG